MADFCGNFMRRIGPWLREHRIGRDNLAAAFPDKTPAEIEDILGGVWDNLGRLGAEFAHLDRIWDHDPAQPGAGHIEFSHRSVERFIALRDDGKPRSFSRRISPTGNCRRSRARRYGLDTAVLFRAPNIGAVATAVQDIRAAQHGHADPDRLRHRGPRRRARRRAAPMSACWSISISCSGVRRHLLRPPLQGQSADRPARAADRLPDPRHARDPARRTGAFASSLPLKSSPRATPTERSTSPARCRRSPTWSKAGSASTRSNGCGCTDAGGRFPRLPRAAGRTITAPS